MVEKGGNVFINVSICIKNAEGQKRSKLIHIDTS